MFNLLFKIFVKDYKNTSDPAVRVRYGVFAGISGIVTNTVLCILKLISGIVCSSVSIIADALNNLSDAASSLITIIGFKLSGKPADRDHPFGHGRIEYICGFLVSTAILIMGGELLISSVKKIVSSESSDYSNITMTVVILIIAILTKLLMYFFNRSTAKKIDSLSMMATAKDSLSDVLSTSVVLIGTLIGYYTSFSIDGYLGVLVSLFILYTGLSTIKDSLMPLLGESANADMIKDIENIVLSYDGILGIHDLNVHNYGPGRYIISLHAEVSASCDIMKTHDTIDIIEKELQTKLGCSATIHMDPIETDNELINTTKDYVAGIISSISEELRFHDFRMVSGHTHTNLIFDVVSPFGFFLTDEQLINEISDKIKKDYPNYYCVITVDKW